MNAPRFIFPMKTASFEKGYRTCPGALPAPPALSRGGVHARPSSHRDFSSVTSGTHRQPHFQLGEPERTDFRQSEPSSPRDRTMLEGATTGHHDSAGKGVLPPLPRLGCGGLPDTHLHGGGAAYYHRKAAHQGI